MKKSFIFLFALLAAAVGCNSNAPQGNVTQVQHPEWTKDAVIYEVNVRQFTPEGTFAALEQHLDRLQELGVDILWLMPIHPIGEEGRKGTLGSYYSCKDYKDVNPEFGTMEEFNHFLEAAHEKGFKVILDWVANHTSRDSKWVSDNLDWYKLDSTGAPAIQYDWTDIAALNYDNKEVYAAMIDAMSFWVEAGVDGFRCDVAGSVPVEFWNEAVPQLKAINPDIFMLAEAEQADLQEKAFDAYYSWSQMNLWYEVAKGKVSADSLANFYVNYAEDKEMPQGTIAMNFTTNHDQNSWHGTNEEFYPDAIKQFTVLAFTVPGMPLIYSGEEASLDKSLEFFEKDDIDWSNDKNGMTDFYKSLIDMRDKHASLWAAPYGGVMVILPTDQPEKIFAFEREAEGDICLALFNFSNEEVTFNVKNHIVTTDKEFTLPAHGYHVIFSVGDCFGDCDEAEMKAETTVE